MVGDQLSQKLTSWMGGGEKKEAGDAEAGGASGPASQQAPSESSGYQGDESFQHVPAEGGMTDSSGFEEVAAGGEDLAEDDDDAFD